MTGKEGPKSMSCFNVICGWPGKIWGQTGRALLKNRRMPRQQHVSFFPLRYCQWARWKSKKRMEWCVCLCDAEVHISFSFGCAYLVVVD